MRYQEVPHTPTSTQRWKWQHVPSGPGLLMPRLRKVQRLENKSPWKKHEIVWLQYFSCNLKCRLSENHILPLVSWAWPQLPAVGSLAEIPHPAPSLSGSWNPLAQPRGRRWGEGGKGGLPFLVGQEEGAEPNAGHAAAPTAL